MSQPVKYPVYVFDTILATHGDVVLSNGWLTAKTNTGGQTNICRYLDIQSVVNQVKVAEVPQVTTLTSVGTTNSITYGIKIVQYLGVALGTKTFPFTVTTPATGTISPTTIHAQFIAQINANSQIKVTASGTTTLILTADAGYPFFGVRATNLGLGFTGFPPTAPTTAGVAARGTAAAITALGGVLNTGGVAFTGSAYTTTLINFTKHLAPGNTLDTEQVDGCYLAFNEGSTNYAALQAYLLELFASFPAGGSTYSDPEILAKI